MNRKLIVVGGGAAGLMAAGWAAKSGCDVAVIEKMERPARKVMITGKGRCNVTNHTDLQGLIAAVMRNPKFLYSAFSAFSADQTMAFFESCGVPLKTERGRRVFPVSDRAVDIADALRRFAAGGASLMRGTVSSLLVSEGRVAGVRLAYGTVLSADAVIVATGGCSYPLTGSTGDGYKLARSVGHTVTSLSPSLVPLEIEEPICRKLMGLSLKNITLTVQRVSDGQPVFREQGEMLFTHFGISGPLVLSASAMLKNPRPGEYRAVIDWKPALSEQQLDARLLREFHEAPNRSFLNILPALLPKKMVPFIPELTGISGDKKANQITREERNELIRLLKSFALTVHGFRPIEEAIVTSGGVSTDEINPKTMESRKIKGLYFAGEILDVDAFTGGYNLQIAFSTGYLAGISAAKSLQKE